MNPRQRIPAPGQREPLLPAGMLLASHCVAVVVVAVFGGGAVSGVISGHGARIVAPEHMSATLVLLAMNPADPAAAWPNDPRPGPAWLTWLCIVAVATVWCVGISAASDFYTQHVRHRRRNGLASATDLRVVGLDHRAAVDKATREYPQLAANTSPRHRHRWRRRRWMR
ncbi:hypothetical protein HLB23_28945 [Nocardia uniformis]|uniref:Uncharacterized protein n=1 Tax=Nocardia uniformis TaxID=53432 RepID=A0A849C562_9NOCA|nr:hypothetical protein [Nocardia uniformis]NNH73834.1 hypothetical protein [Nocardia uniformis]